MKQTYLYILWQHNKKLSVLIIGFILCQAFFTYKQVETTPFFNYGMYSAPCPTLDTYSTISVYENSNKISLFNQSISASFLQYQLAYYNKLISMDSIDPVKFTIESRFKNYNTLNQYLIKNISNNKSSINQFQIFLSKCLKNNVYSRHENYEWVKNNFKIVNSKNLN